MRKTAAFPKMDDSAGFRALVPYIFFAKIQRKTSLLEIDTSLKRRGEYVNFSKEATWQKYKSHSAFSSHLRESSQQDTCESISGLAKLFLAKSEREMGLIGLEQEIINIRTTCLYNEEEEKKRKIQKSRLGSWLWLDQEGFSILKAQQEQRPREFKLGGRLIFRQKWP